MHDKSFGCGRLRRCSRKHSSDTEGEGGWAPVAVADGNLTTGIQLEFRAFYMAEGLAQSLEGSFWQHVTNLWAPHHLSRNINII